MDVYIVESNEDDGGTSLWGVFADLPAAQRWVEAQPVDFNTEWKHSDYEPNVWTIGRLKDYVEPWTSVGGRHYKVWAEMYNVTQHEVCTFP